MSEINEENALYDAAMAARLRREQRRQKILARSGDRMKKIMGENYEPEQDSKTPTESTESLENSTEDHNAALRHRLSAPQNESVEPATLPDLDTTLPDLDPTQLLQKVMSPQEPDNNVLNEDTLNFTKKRQMLCAIIALLVRISLSFPFGQTYVQTMVYPFVALEVAILGYQRGIEMDLSVNAQGGIWLAVLVFSGIKQEVIDTYKQLLGAFSSVIDDFCVYFFTFMIVHLFL